MVWCGPAVRLVPYHGVFYLVLVPFNAHIVFLSYHVVQYRIVLYHSVKYRIDQYHNLSYHIVKYRKLSYRTGQYGIVSCRIL